MKNAKPNSAHFATAELEKLGKLDCVITQNVDGLHQKAGVPPEKVFELHGSFRRIICIDCGETFSVNDVINRIKEEEIPDCKKCRGILKPGVVFFGEPLPEDVLHESINRSRCCDLIIVIGSSFVVYPAAHIPIYAVESGAKMVIINIDSTSFDPYATVVINGKAGDTTEKIMEQVRNRLVV